MGAITSASTVYATAYLTEVGRKYLFQEGNNVRFVTLPDGTKIDKLKIERFSLGDPDVNYQLPYFLESGDIPDLSGENESSITGTKGRNLTNLINPTEATMGTGNDILEYTSSADVIMFDLNKTLNQIPIVKTQELITLLNNAPTLEAAYTVLPKNFGDNQVVNNQLVITLLEPTNTTPGYRMRIFYPSIENNHNKLTIQFEKAFKTIMTTGQFNSASSQATSSDLGVTQ
jgi:hypothetical protein